MISRRLTTPDVSLIASRILSCIVVDSTRSASDETIFGSFNTVNGSVNGLPSIVSRTEYLPGAAIGVAVVGPMPQCVTKRTSLPEKSGSDQMYWFSLGVVRISTIFAGSYIKFQDTWFRPGRAP